MQVRKKEKSRPHHPIPFSLPSLPLSQLYTKYVGVAENFW